MSFPESFEWGAASSAYQIEGAARAGGRGPSIWDTFCRRPNAVFQGHTGDTACDHYHRMPEDVALMRQLGLRAYRFSIAWPRVLPNGVGAVSESGLRFYERLVDELLEANIVPWATLFHWDFPQVLFEQGGWLNRDSADWFAEYAAIVCERLSDRVKHWITINEPQIYIGLGHMTGTHAPGLKLATREALLAGHHTLLAHGKATQALRAGARQPLQVGWAPCGKVDAPASDSIADQEAALREMFSVSKRDAWNNTWWADPVCLGRYPEDGLRLFAHDAPTVLPGDMETIHQPLDFYGVNIYSCGRFRADRHGHPEPVPGVPGSPQTSFRWAITPECLYWGPKLLHERYALPIVITENGMSNLDWIMGDGRAHDPQRIDYIRAHLIQLERAIDEGVDVRGYFHWSIMDNFEWAEGYRERFGLVHVDYQTLTRTPKDSATWYRRVIETNGRSLKSPAIEPASDPADLEPATEEDSR